MRCAFYNLEGYDRFVIVWCRTWYLFISPVLAEDRNESTENAKIYKKEHFLLIPCKFVYVHYMFVTFAERFGFAQYACSFLYSNVCVSFCNDDSFKF